MDALCLPVVTFGAATSALYYTVVKCFRQGERDTFHIFWDAFKADLKPGIAVSIVSVALLLGLAYGYSIMKANWSSTTGQILFVIYDILLVIPLGTLAYMFPMQGRFELPVSTLITNSFFLAMRHIFSTIILTLFLVEIVLTTYQYWWPVFFTPVLGALIVSLFLERIFAKYLDAEQKEKFENKSE
jgi:uncharacterized membrane protein YesL